MSRRPPTESRAEQNRNTLKQLVKLEANKSCSDCKRNKHPRWASWNLGVFICIRCSGIHRGMGTHISRVKSVDLDSWTDEQLQSMLRWGNSRANKYWESKLAPGHIPSEAKIENFIRTKYESKRWVMDGPMPDPATLDVDGDDDVPLNVVQEKAKLERSASQKAAGSPATVAPPRAAPRQAPAIDLFGDEPAAAPARPSTGPPGDRLPPPKAGTAPPKQTKPADSLLGLDFFGGPQASPPARPSSTTATSSSSAPSRPDLKQSILSLYASKPAAAQQPQRQHAPSGSFSSQSPPVQSPAAQPSSFGGLNDAFSSLNFASPSAQPPPKPSPFANLAMPTQKSPPVAPKPTTTSFGGGGGFFDTPSSPPIQTKPAAQPAAPQRGFSSSSGFGDFFSSTSPAAPSAPSAPSAPQNQGNDLFDLMGSPQPTSPAAPKPAPTTASYSNSAFNLSNPAPPSQPVAPLQPAAKAQTSSLSGLNSGFDAWGSTDAWNDSKMTTTTTTTTTTTASSTGFGWGPSANAAGGFGSQQKVTSPKISGDEDFGGWSSAPHAPTSATSNTTTKPAGGFGGNSDDLFSNVWE